MNSFKVESDGSVTTLPLEVGVRVDASHGSGSFVREVHSNVNFQIELAAEVENGLTVTQSRGGLERAVMESVDVLSEGVRSSVARLAPTHYFYEMRSVMYYLGYLSSLLIAGVDWPDELADIKGVSPMASGVNSSDFVYNPKGGNTREVMYVLALAARGVGKKRMFVYNEQFSPASKPRSADARRRYLHHTIRTVSADAASCGLYGDHMFAFSRGLSCGLVLRSHSDEGGWVRKALKQASYPTCSGMISVNPDDFPLLPRFNTVQTGKNMFLENCVNVLIETAALLSDSDPALEVSVSSVMYNRYLNKDGSSNYDVGDRLHSRPSAFDDIAGVLHQMENYCVKYLNIINADTPSEGCHGSLRRGTFEHYLEEDAVDRHFDLFEFLPYLYVESAVVLKHEGCGRAVGPKAGTVRTLPLFPSAPRTMASDCSGTTRSGKHQAHRVFYDYKDCSLRGMGAFYMCAPAWNGGRDKGLGSMKFYSRERIEDCVTMMRRSEQKVLGEMAWIRSSCPVPAPGEGRNWGGKVALAYFGGLARAVRTASTEDVHLYTSAPSIRSVTRFGAAQCSMDRNINAKYRQYLNDFDYEMEEMIEDFLFSSDVTPVVRNVVGIREGTGSRPDQPEPHGEVSSDEPDTRHVAPYATVEQSPTSIEEDITSGGAVDGGDGS
ncbi:coat protein [Diatom colony associated dsRNA virus 13]|uniref:coat protein n=1 Tax=Diatom colony associated dsRNA virus 13 TaxID=1678173 RepID=UPI0007A64851|nr:coat protein [Diatom colony associated dsRNA virus 13]BAU79509.1 coat protein [Diatom colony associated dsRNA virus 13]